MKHSEANQGRIFIIRLEHGEIIHENIERFAEEHHVKAAFLTIVGGIDKDSKIIVGPESDTAQKIVPKEYLVSRMHEITGTGTLFPGPNGKPYLHMHIACGRDTNTLVGCIRRGVKTWHVLEIILVELLNTSAKRVPDKETGFELLEP
ncbi:MAG: DNA-binding protein [Bacteroidales bacterium]|nr:DNA-binding protein [Bacteroidales bacterium]